MDTLDTVPADWATGRCALGHHTFEGEVNVRFVPCKVISSEPKSNLPSRTYIIWPIPRFDPHARTIPVAQDVRPSNYIVHLMQ